MNAKYLFYVSIMSLIISCSGNKSSEHEISEPNSNINETILFFSDIDFDSTLYLNGQTIIPNWPKGQASDIILVAPFLVTSNDVDDSLFQISSLNDDSFQKYLGKTGFQKGEIMTNRFSLSLKASNEQTFWTFDFVQKRFSEFNLREHGTLPINQYSYESTDIKSAIRLSWTSKNQILGITVDGLGKFVLFDSLGNRISQIGEYSSEFGQEFSKSIIAQLHQGKLKSNRNGDKFLRTCLNLNRFEFLDLELNRLIQINGPTSIEPQFDEVDINGTTVLSLDRDNNYYTFVDGALTEQFIYLLYSGKKWNSDPTGKLNCDQIFVFNHNGDPVRQIIMNQEVLSIAVDEKQECIYAVAADHSKGILKFQLNASEKQK
uniref:BF3164 family lipoprotein n=1 Tax=Roseivirga sp. TaxID=1964215 RepID=UPI0040488C39